MTVQIALFLSADGIALAHRQRSGHWSFIADTPFDPDTLEREMAKLRSLAEERAGKDAATLLVLPDDQILYTSLTAPTDDPELTGYRIEDGLEGLTPYAVSELLYDWRAVDTDRVKLAVVATETLDEAREFARSHGFKPAGFAAVPPQERFPGVPLFDLGPEAKELTFPEEGIAFGADEWGTEEFLEQAEEPETPAKDERAPSATDDSEAEEKADVPEEASAAADTDTETDTGDAPKPSSASKKKASRKEKSKAKTPPAEPVADAPSAKSEETDAGSTPSDDTLSDDAETGRSSPPDKGAEEAKDSAEPDEKPRDASPSAGTAAEDPQAPAEEADLDRKPMDAASPPDQGETTTPAQVPDPADLDPDEALAAMAARDDTPSPPHDDVPAPPSDPEPAGGAGSMEDPALTAPVRPISDNDQDPDLPPAPSSAVLAARKASAAFEAQSKPPEFSARHDPVPARDTGEGTGDRPTESLADEQDNAVAEPAQRDDATAAERNALAKRLSRVREASRSRTAEGRGPDNAEPLLRAAPKRTQDAVRRPGFPPTRAKSPIGTADGDPARKGRLSGLMASGSGARDPEGANGDGTRPALGLTSFLPRAFGRSGAPDPKPAKDVSDTGARRISGAGRLTALGDALNATDNSANAQETEAPKRTDVQPEAGPVSDDNLTGGLLGRNEQGNAGTSFRTGLIVTVVLLILLVAIAVWSALFLPNSPVARLLSGERETAASEPLDAPQPPEAIVAPPVIGELDTPRVARNSLPDETTFPLDTVTVAPEDEAAADGIRPETPEEQPDLAAAPAEAEAEPVAETVEPLAPLPEDGLPSVAETEAAFSEFGIWQRPPERPDLAPVDTLSDLDVSTSDPEVGAVDAIALAPPGIDPAERPAPVASPPPFGSTAAGERSGPLVPATPDGVVTPQGVRVVAGAPPVGAIPRPLSEAPPAAVPTFDLDGAIEGAILGTVRPAPRPDELGLALPAEGEDDTPDVSTASLTPQTPSTRQAGSASLFRLPEADGADAAVENAALETVEPSSQFAVAASLLPRSRPGNIDEIVANAARPAAPSAPAVEAAAVAPGPSIPTSADVARAATQSNELRLRSINLIGVTGTPTERRALVRLPSGRFVRVAVGDRLDGGRVAAIGETTLQYVRNGRTLTLDIPG